MTTTGNGCPDGYRPVEPGERIADPHMMIGKVVRALRADGIKLDPDWCPTDEDQAAMVAAMGEILRVLDVKAAPEMKYEAHVVA